MLQEQDGRHWVDALIVAMEEAVDENDREACEFYGEWANCIMSVDFARGYMRA